MHTLRLDKGDRKIEIVLSDPTLSITQGFRVCGCNSKENYINAFKKIVKEHGITENVIGFPKYMTGSLGKELQEIVTKESPIWM